MKNVKEWKSVETKVSKILDNLDLQILDILQIEAHVSNH